MVGKNKQLIILANHLKVALQIHIKIRWNMRPRSVQTQAD